ncbi:MAG: UvrD-helicase domain-containing protein [Chloroflexi bacterium]|nr:UvrD-helicase domain-containing protein [Chloroflexota bacterium]
MRESPNLHPIVAAMRPSPEQIPAITTWDRDVVVTAGAGAGKTLTLVARYLALLAEGCPLRGAIAITFTEKAAREMRNRVRDEVRRYVETPGLDAGEHERWDAVYAGLDAARISTIHGLCAEILRSHPAEAAVDPRFDVLNEGQGNLLRRQAADETLALAAEDPDLVPLFELLGERGFRDTLDTLLRRRLEATETLAALPPDVLAQWQGALTARQTAALAELLVSPDWQDAATMVLGEAAAKGDDLLEIQRQAAAAALAEAATVEVLDDRLAALARLAAINLSGGSAKAWPGGKEQVTEIKAALKALRELWKDAVLLQLALTPLDEALAAAMPGLRACFQFAHDRYTAAKRARNALDFDDLEADALALLESNAAVRARWQAETAALLVDEFQDTNDRQRRLVRCLNGAAGKLFLVGDAKQSIYGFRGADVTVFRAERQAIVRAGGAVMTLDTSYRAHRALIAGLNDLLRPVLGEADDPARPWVEPFAPLRHHRADAGPGFTAPHIELHLALGSKSEAGLDRAADALAARLAALVEGGGDVQLAANGQLRPLSYGDVAILCRASTSFAAYENALERAGIPFLTVAGRGFYGRPEIRDLLNALDALADPTDDLALAGLLRSPTLALSDAALFRLCEARDRAGRPTSLWQTLRAAGAELAGEDGSRAARAASLVSDLQAQAGRAPVADLLKAFLDATGYRAALVAAGQARAARNVAKLLADAHASGLVSVGEFLAYVAELRDSGTREGEARATAEGAIQIMSVHAAKGLEFPVVVLGDGTYNSPARNGLLLNPALGILLPQKDDAKTLSAIYRLGKLTADDQEAAESHRLLYVAATRAREKLILSGCITAKADGTPGALGGWLGRLSGEDALGLAGVPVAVDEVDPEPRRLDLTIGDTPVACTIYGAGWAWAARRSAATAQPEIAVSLPPPLLGPVAAEPVETDGRAAEQERDPGQRVWRVVPAVTRPRAPAWVVGKLVHEALAAWRFPDAAGFFAHWAEAHARSYGLTDARQLADAVRESGKLLRRFEEHPLHAEMAGAERRLHEVPYSLVAADGRVESGIIDALYLRADGWTIVEFKTDHVRDTAALDLLLAEEDYLAQAARYAAAVEKLLSQGPHVRLCLLDMAGAVLTQSLATEA